MNLHHGSKVQQVYASSNKPFSRNVDEEEHGGFKNMIRLVYLNEPRVLFNVLKRYVLNDICVLVALDFSSSTHARVEVEANDVGALVGDGEGIGGRGSENPSSVVDEGGVNKLIKQKSPSLSLVATGLPFGISRSNTITSVAALSW
ncbi:hypothetical protein VNO78_18932 [Psophocarpus tetragonolobus]|uniref:Uncharacterized protein n=1 Tax=Psophocarpus tetragonolobus TaxID=3891 RepID=A0AAN9S861_PSOTE